MASHRTDILLTRTVPAQIDAGAGIVLQMRLSCPEGCDLRGVPIAVLAAGEHLPAREPATGDADGVREIALQAPGRAGDHVWTIFVPAHATGEAVHEDASLIVSFTTVPHTTSLAVWDVASPAALGRSFAMKVGVACSAGCRLAGRAIEVCDQTGARVGGGLLSEGPWPGTNGLYVAELQPTAPTSEGLTWWTARFPADAPGLPHEPAAAPFSFLTARPPDHRVIVRVTDRETAAPIEHVAVRIGVYRASTNADGLATLELPEGVYDLDAWKAGYETRPRTLDVRADLSIQLQVLPSPDPDLDDQRVWM